MKSFQLKKRFLFPHKCVVCNGKLGTAGEAVCTSCLMDLNYTDIGNSPGNEFEKAFWTYIPVHSATTLLYYEREDLSADILFMMKYENRKDLCLQMGCVLADRIKPSGFFEGIDLMIPIPLHPNKLRRRGYNQAEILAQGISLGTGIPICNDAIVRTHDDSTQTKKAYSLRQGVQSGFFSATADAVTLLKDKHVLIVDDVLTSGNTMFSCARAVSHIPGISISIVTLAWSQ